ncbi:hypothetical protein CBS101457_001613 [Exobasidium rhododendri]|nr:hypothetical protein CBS101457_001613 [Exobasidium rhododendri]
MRLSTIAFSFIALGVAAVSASVEQESNAPVVRDFARKMEVRDPRKHSKRRSEQLITNGELTWYGGGQLDNPACGGSAPKSTDMVVAVKEGGMFKCGDTVHIHYKGKMVAAKVRDYCGGCSSTHLDATQGLFSSLAGSLDAGVLNDLHIRLIPN